MVSVITRSGLQSAKMTSLVSRMSRTASAMAVGVGDNASLENARPYEEIPGPKPLPIIGNLHQFIPGIGELGDKNLISQHRYLMKKYGKIVKVSNIPGRRDIVLVFDPKYAEEAYRSEGPWPDRDSLQSLIYYRKVTRKDFFQGVGGILTEAGEEWKKFRTKVNPPMMQPRVSSMYLRPVVEVANEFIERTKSLRDSKGEMPDDYVNELNKWALESIAMIALDKRLGCLEPNLKRDSTPQKMINAVDDFFECLEILEMRPPLWKIISTPSWRRYVKALDYFSDVAKKTIDDAIKKMMERKPGKDYEPSVLERILLKDPDPRTACVMALDMLIAGVDTTSLNVANMMYNLSKNQDKQEHLFKEVVKFLPNREDEITMEKIENMKYLRSCIKESMSVRLIADLDYRILGILTSNKRGTIKEIVLGNYRIPKNVTIMMSHLVMCLMDEYYPLASRYIPERWLKYRPEGGPNSIGSPEDFDRTKASTTNPFVYMPFGFGPRMCVGKRFAELELTVIMAKMIRNFHIEYNYGDMEFVSRLLFKPINPLKYKMTDRPI